MAFENTKQNDNSLFKAANNNLNFLEKSSNDLYDLVKSFNIIDPENLTNDQLSIILNRIDDYDGLFTTQQLENVDYSKFNKHVFFDSAVNKVVFSFDRIQNIPYDKDELENIKYFNKNDGYTNYILKNIFPKSKGFTKFRGNEALVVYDEQGKLLNDIEQGKIKKVGILNPLGNRLSFDFWVNLPTLNNLNTNNKQVIFKKIQYSNNVIQNGFICYLNSEANQVYLNFLCKINQKTSHSKILLESSLLNSWQHVAINVHVTKKIEFILNGKLFDDVLVVTNQIKNKFFPEEFKEKDVPFTLGGIFYLDENSNINNNLDDYSNFHGSIDEFRMFFKFRSINTIKKEMHKNIYAQKGLVLYLRLNEPSGDYTNSCLSVDFSGNKLHGILFNLNNGLSIITDTDSYRYNSDTPLRLERLEDSPVLNAAYSETISKRQDLIVSAKDYDSNNPNLIFKLMPRHYFLDASDFQNLPVFSNDEDYSLSNNVAIDESNNITPSSMSADRAANNELVNIVLIWAKFFDKLKLYINSITNMLSIDYDSVNNKSIVGMQIPLLCKIYGVDFKEIFSSVTKDKLNKENLTFDDIVSEISIRKIQNILWQRFLINTQDFLKSKGTVKSIETAFNSFGIDYTKFIDIKEYSYNNTITQEKNFSFKNLELLSIDFFNSQNLKSANFSNTTEGFSENKIFFEIADIKHKNQVIANQSEIIDINNSSIAKGLSADDWSIELFFKYKDTVNNQRFLNQTKINQIFNPALEFSNEQYLFVLDLEEDSEAGCVVVVKYVRENGFNTRYGNIIIEIQPVLSSNFNQTLVLNDVNIFDIEKHLVLTQKRENNKLTYYASINDLGNQTIIKNSISDVSSIEITGDSLDKRIDNNDYSFFSQDKKLNFRIGDYIYSTDRYLNSTITSNSIFEGEIIKARIWKHCLTEKEILSHTKNIKNYGKSDLKPLDFIIVDTGIKHVENHRTIDGDVYEWIIEDISFNSVLNLNNVESLNTCKVKTRNQNQTDNVVIKPCFVLCKTVNSNFDEVNSYNKVNIISYENEINKQLTHNFEEFPANEVPLFFNYDKINRVSIDMSIVKTINEDISKIISDINDFTKQISNSMSIYEYQYTSLEKTRENYFSKFSDSEYINYASVGDVFKYFDNIMSSVLYDIVPSRVRFEGFNFVYESHSLERHKYEHKNKDSINSIITPEVRLDYSRDFVLSRRNIDYNTSRSQES